MKTCNSYHIPPYPPIPPPDPAWAALATRFAAIGLTPAFARDTPRRHAILSSEPAHVALRVFQHREPASPEELAELFPLAQQIAGHFRLDLPNGLVLFSDWPNHPGAGAVRPPGETTAILHAAARPHAAGRNIWDLGCGSGTLALLLAPVAAKVTGTDINPRAIALARWNSAINQRSADFQTGSLADPIADRSFELIVAQPPYLPAPAANPSLFLHGGIRGDEIAREILALAPHRLTENGIAILFCDWLLRPGEQLADRIPAIDADTRVYCTFINADAWAEAYGQSLHNIAKVAQCLVTLRPRSSPRLHIASIRGDWPNAIEAAAKD